MYTSNGWYLIGWSTFLVLASAGNSIGRSLASSRRLINQNELPSANALTNSSLILSLATFSTSSLFFLMLFRVSLMKSKSMTLCHSERSEESNFLPFIPFVWLRVTDHCFNFSLITLTNLIALIILSASSVSLLSGLPTALILLLIRSWMPLCGSMIMRNAEPCNPLWERVICAAVLTKERTVCLVN